MNGHPLMSALNQVGQSALVLSSGVVAPVIPGLEIEGLGAVALPPTAEGLASIQRLASRAPYGRGLETVVDLDVRKVWQIDASQVRLTNPDWDATLREVLQRVASDLQISGEIEAHLYKLLLYEPGGFFAPHRDSEKTERMFATLVIGLPSAHQGGQLVVEHEGRSYEADFSQHSAFRVQFAAFYADCLHQIKPVTAGHRLCLIYNLSLPTGAQPRAPQLEGSVAQTTAELAKLVPAKLEKLVVQLSHEYTVKGLWVGCLKGGDRARWELLCRAAQSLKLHCHLGTLRVEQEGIAEEKYSRYGRGPYFMAEVLEQKTRVVGLVDENGNPAWKGSMEVDESQLLLNAPLDELAFRRSIHEATGNEGVTMERRYRTAVAVIWSERDRDRLLADQGPRRAIPQLRQRLLDRRPAESLAQAIVDKWVLPSYGPSESSKSYSRLMLLCLRQLRNTPLSLAFLTRIFPNDFNGREGRALVRLAKRTGWEAVRSALLGFFEKAQQCQYLGGIWRAYLRIFQALCCSPPAPRGERLRLIEQLAASLWQCEQEWHQNARFPRARENFLEWWIPALSVASPALLAQVLQQYEKEDLYKVLLPALERLQEARSLAGYQALWSICLLQLDHRLSTVPAQPEDWTRKSPSSCACQDCAQVNAFLASPCQDRLAFQAPEARRHHLQELFRWADVDLHTEKSRPALTLVFKKNQNSYERAVQQRATDVEHRARLQADLRPLA